MKSYCMECGKEQVQEWTGKYERNNGAKEYRMVCPTNPCEHSGHAWKRVDSVLESIFRGDHKCTRCGRQQTID